MNHSELVEIFNDPDHITSQKEINELFKHYMAQHDVMIKMDGVIHALIKAEEKK